MFTIIHQAKLIIQAIADTTASKNKNKGSAIATPPSIRSRFNSKIAYFSTYATAQD